VSRARVHADNAAGQKRRTRIIRAFLNHLLAHHDASVSHSLARVLHSASGTVDKARIRMSLSVAALAVEAGRASMDVLLALGRCMRLVVDRAVRAELLRVVPALSSRLVCSELV